MYSTVGTKYFYFAYFFLKSNIDSFRHALQLDFASKYIIVVFYCKKESSQLMVF